MAFPDDVMYLLSNGYIRYYPDDLEDFCSAGMEGNDMSTEQPTNGTLVKGVTHYASTTFIKERDGSYRVKDGTDKFIGMVSWSCVSQSWIYVAEQGFIPTSCLLHICSRIIELNCAGKFIEHPTPTTEQKAQNEER